MEKPQHQRSVSETEVTEDSVGGYLATHSIDDGNSEIHSNDPSTPYLSSTPGSPYMLSRNSSYFGESPREEEWETPLERVNLFEIFNNLDLPSKLDKWQLSISSQKDKIKKQQERLRTTGNNAKNRAVKEWRKRVPTADEQLARYRRRMQKSVDDLNKGWNETFTPTLQEKISFISAVVNIFISGYLIGGFPEYYYWWFTVQLLYFMPIRCVTYHKKGYHYFLADLCYFVNFLTMSTIWLFPKSKRLFISTYCLAYGNNAVAVVLWRNSLVLHSLDKVTSLFVHVMPPVTLHCIVHLTPDHLLKQLFPAVYDIKFSSPGSPEHYSLGAMVIWATLPYAVWQLFYHFFITVRRREKIAAGRPTSFTWLRRSYAKTFIGKAVLSLPDALQEPAFMLIQYSYAVLTILPAPLWFWSRWSSAFFLFFVFCWSVWNGANYYMDVFGQRFKKELEQMKKDVNKWQNSPGALSLSPPVDPFDGEHNGGAALEKSEGAAASGNADTGNKRTDTGDLLDKIPMLDAEGSASASGVEHGGLNGQVVGRK